VKSVEMGLVPFPPGEDATFMSYRFEYVADGSQDGGAIVAINEYHRRARQAAILAAASNSAQAVPPPPPVVAYDHSEDAATLALMEQQRRQIAASWNFAAPPPSASEDDLPAPPTVELPVLVSQAVIIPYQKTTEGYLIRAVTLPLRKIIQMILKDPKLMQEFDPRKWEELIAATYQVSGLYDEVTLTPRSGDDGKDVIAVKKGFGSVRLLESVKRYAPNRVVEASEVRDLLGALSSDQKASKGILSTTSMFAPKVKTNPQFTQYMPTRLELVDGKDLLERFKEYTTQGAVHSGPSGT
jgi:restriction system protein